MVYGICNILGLSNACTNPVLYGYFNENFRKEYKSIYRAIPAWAAGAAGPGGVRRLSSVCRMELNQLRRRGGGNGGGGEV